MMKRNDGYALSYVMVVLLVLAAVAIASMTLAMQSLKTQKLVVEQMQDKYVAQGMVEQVVAQLEHADSTDEIANIIAAYNQTDSPSLYCSSVTTDGNVQIYSITAMSEKHKVSATFTLKPTPKDSSVTGTGDTPTDATTTEGYTVTYLSYATETITGGGT